VISAQLAEARQTHDTVQAELAAERQAHAATQARLEAGRAELESAGHQLADLRTQFSTELRELGRNSALFHFFRRFLRPGKMIAASNNPPPVRMRRSCMFSPPTKKRDRTG
jgi:predicted  nucleic acid-binding Zn-ribbon protein